MTIATNATAQAQSEAREAWNSIAGGYDAFVTPTHFWLGNEAVRRAAVAPGTRFLDVACGSGGLGIPAARQGAHVTAVDLSPLMIERIQARARQEGLVNLEARVMDGHALEFADDMFDLAGSQFGVMLFPDLPRALREMRRVVRPGGRVLMVAFGPPSQVEFINFFVAAVRAVDPGFAGLPSDPPPLPFQVADPATLRRRLAEAGLTNIGLDTVTETLWFHAGDDMWSWLVNSNPVARMLIAGLTEEHYAEIRRVLTGMLRERSEGRGPAALTSTVHIALGTK